MKYSELCAFLNLSKNENEERRELRVIDSELLAHIAGGSDEDSGDASDEDDGNFGAEEYGGSCSGNIGKKFIKCKWNKRF